jgi:hypothetical protein
MRGIPDNAMAPQAARSTGTMRQPATRSPREVSAAGERAAAALGAGIVAGQEHHAGREAVAMGDAGLGRDRAQEVSWPMQQQAATIAAAPVGADGATVGEPAERGQRGVDQRAAAAVVEFGDHAEAATVVFETRRIQAPGRDRAHRPSASVGSMRRSHGWLEFLPYPL